jgi:hypothetical protein
MTAVLIAWLPAPHRRVDRCGGTPKEGIIVNYDAATGKLAKTRSVFKGSPGMRSSTHELKDGAIYGPTHGTGQISAIARPRMTWPSSARTGCAANT